MKTEWKQHINGFSTINCKEGGRRAGRGGGGWVENGVITRTGIAELLWKCGEGGGGLTSDSKWGGGAEHFFLSNSNFQKSVCVCGGGGGGGLSSLPPRALEKGCRYTHS